MCGSNTGTVGENGAQMCVGDTGKFEENGAKLCGGETGTVGENGAQLCVVVILGNVWKMEHSSVWC